MKHFRTDAPLLGEPKPQKEPTMITQETRDRAQARIDWDTAKAAERPKNNRDARQKYIERLDGTERSDSAKTARQKYIDRLEGKA